MMPRHKQNHSSGLNLLHLERNLSNWEKIVANALCYQVYLINNNVTNMIIIMIELKKWVYNEYVKE